MSRFGAGSGMGPRAGHATTAFGHGYARPERRNDGAMGLEALRRRHAASNPVPLGDTSALEPVKPDDVEKGSS